jgi:hypothetical protein
MNQYVISCHLGRNIHLFCIASINVSFLIFNYQKHIVKQRLDIQLKRPEFIIKPDFFL